MNKSKVSTAHVWQSVISITEESGYEHFVIDEYDSIDDLFADEEQSRPDNNTGWDIYLVRKETEFERGVDACRTYRLYLCPHSGKLEDNMFREDNYPARRVPFKYLIEAASVFQ